jgi:hypothetical protein
MAIIKGIEIWWVKCDPKRPETKFNKENGTWELQIRTTDKARAQGELKSLGIKMNPSDEDGKIVYKGNIKKKSKKKDGDELVPNAPVKFVGGDLSEIDPNTVGNGSIANIRVFEREYMTGDVKKKTVVLMSVQVTKLNKYVPKPRTDDFEMTDMEVNEPAAGMEDDDDQVVDNNGDDDQF